MLHKDEWRRVLSHRELKVALLIAEGASNKQVARQLGLSEGTVKLHLYTSSAKWAQAAATL
jgi:DNA-binding NarL/FixJ family response regulator